MSWKRNLICIWKDSSHWPQLQASISPIPKPYAHAHTVREFIKGQEPSKLTGRENGFDRLVWPCIGKFFWLRSSVPKVLPACENHLLSCWKRWWNPWHCMSTTQSDSILFMSAVQSVYQMICPLNPDWQVPNEVHLCPHRWQLVDEQAMAS